MANVDFTLDDIVQKLLPATADQTRQIVKEELVNFEPRVEIMVKRVVKLEVMESEARIKREIQHFVAVDRNEIKKRLK